MIGANRSRETLGGIEKSSVARLARGKETAVVISQRFCSKNGGGGVLPTWTCRS
jgi:hypothetical protein